MRGARINTRLPSRLLAVFLAALALCVGNVAARQQPDEKPAHAADSTDAGQAIFSASCAGCHGLDGRGGERAPGIVSNARVQRMSDADVSALISNGIPDTGMPAFRSLGPEQVKAVVGYLRSLQGQNVAQALPGSPAHGKTVFFGKGECSTCHMMRGEGGFMGPDLTTFGATRGAKDILDTFTNPARIPDPAYRLAVATLRDGGRLSGILRNEDNFSIQLQTADGTFHFLSRSDVQKLDYQPQSAMPADYGKRLDRFELNDLVSYLISVGHSVAPDAASQDEDLREEDFRD